MSRLQFQCKKQTNFQGEHLPEASLPGINTGTDTSGLLSVGIGSRGWCPHSKICLVSQPTNLLIRKELDSPAKAVHPKGLHDMGAKGRRVVLQIKPLFCPESKSVLENGQGGASKEPTLWKKP